MARRRGEEEPELTLPKTTSNTPEEVGFTKRAAKASGGQRRSAQTSTDAYGKQHYVAPVVPDPNIRYGDHRVLQRTDFLFIVVDDRRAAGDQVVWIAPTKMKADDAKKAAAEYAKHLDEETRSARPNAPPQ